jgi:hypothetical protein
MITLSELRTRIDRWAFPRTLEDVERAADLEAAASRLPRQMQTDLLHVLRGDKVGPVRRARLEQALLRELNR